MADTRGTFRLKNVRQDVLNNEYVPIPDVWVGNNDFGYSTWANESKMTRTNINTGLAYHTAASPYPSERWWKKSAMSSTENGYNCVGGGKSWVTKIEYSTGTINTSVPNTVAETNTTGTISANEKGYQFRGTWNGTGRSYTMKITFADETWAQLPTSNSTKSDTTYATGVNSGSGTGYVHGGPSPGSPPYGEMYPAKITFSNDTWAYIPAASPWHLRNAGTGKLRTPTNAWYSGGSAFPGYSSRTDKFTYTNETWAINPTAQLPYGIWSGASYPYNGEKGALVGGAGPSPANSQAFTLTFATDTWDVTSIAADSDKYGDEDGWNAGCSAAENLGSTPGVDGSSRWFDNASLYTGNAVEFSGSTQYLQLSDTSDLEIADSDFTMECWFYQHTDATSGSGSHTLMAKWDNDGRKEFIFRVTESSGQKLHWLSTTDGASNQTITGNTTITNNEWHHAAATRSSGTIRLFLDGTLQSSTLSQSSTHQNNHEFMIAANGSSGIEQFFDGAISNVRFIKGQVLYTANFSITDKKLKESLTTTSQGATASNVKLLCCNQSTVNGSTVTPVTIETVGTPTVITQTAVGVIPPAATPTASSTPQSPAPISPTAFFMAGRDPGPSEYSSCGKIQFASETRSALPGSNIPARKFVCGTSSTLAGYCFGDSNQVAKLLYATDASSTLPSTLPGGYRYKSAISNDTVAFTFGGWQNYSTIDKLTFSNDTVSANTPTNRPPENLRYFTGQLSGPSKGYFCTGATSPSYPGRDKKCHYITFATDSGSEGPEAPEIRDAVGSCSNATVGYITGGRGPGSPQEKSNTSKFTFATESWSNVPGAPLSAGTYSLSGTSNQTFAYFSGGSTGGAGPAVKATTRKFTFASETMGPGTSLDVPRWGFGYTANTESNHPQTTPQPNIPHVI